MAFRMGEKASQKRWSLRRKLLVVALVALILLAIALGVGLGLTLGGNGDDAGSGDNVPTVTGSPLPTPTTKLPWTPKVNDTWQIVLENNIELDVHASTVTPDVAVFDIDLFTTPQETIDTLHRLGKKVICYFSGGTYEPGRPDSNQFQASDMGKELPDWPGEKWLDLSSANVKNIMKARVQLAGQKGCDGIDPDNVDGYQNDNGIKLTAYDSISFLSYLSNISTPLNLTMGLKNAGDIISKVLPIVHFSVNEQCVDNNECSTFHPFIDAGKPVFHIEYPKGTGSQQGLKSDVVSRYCSTTGAAQGSDSFSTVLKNMNLDGWVEYCNGNIQITAMNQSSSDG